MSAIPLKKTAMPDIPDLESLTVPEDHRDLRLWLRMLTCCNLVESEIRSRLRSEYGTTLPRFDMMAQLLRTPGGMKMSELSRHMMVTNGNITGITDQLEKERSEEHTSELQSLMRISYAVFCLKKKKETNKEN